MQIVTKPQILPLLNFDTL